MATVKKIEGKRGTSYKITVSAGRDYTGRQIRHYMTWTPERPMTPRQMEKEVQRAAYEFERPIEQGYQLDNRQTFATFAEYYLKQRTRSGVKEKTIDAYREMLKRINQAIGHIKLIDLRPQHLNAFYENMEEPGVAKKRDKARAKQSLAEELNRRGLTRAEVATRAGVSLTTLQNACNGAKILLENAAAISAAMGAQTEELFLIEISRARLSPSTVSEYHRLIHAILAQAEREMLVPYNAAAKATPPKVPQKEAHYFQPEEISRIFEALEGEPLKWKAATHLLIVTGCRRGEIMGLRWSRVDFVKKQIKIDTNLQYSSKRGVYPSTTKTPSSERTIMLPEETMELLRELKAWQEAQRKMLGDIWQETDYLITKDDGSPFSPDNLTEWLKKFSRRHGLPHITPHAFRHTAASILIHSGQDIVTVSKRLGHAKASTTTDIYSHIIEEADEQASECLAEILYRTAARKKATG